MNVERPSDFAVGVLLTQEQAQVLRDQLDQALKALVAVTEMEGEGQK